VGMDLGQEKPLISTIYTISIIGLWDLNVFIYVFCTYDHHTISVWHNRNRLDQLMEWYCISPINTVYIK
ncbi:hypothetical protein, partial [Acinetobacter baumannii]|uniref:hypothetical protein n=1 Tax=Acinetobacter baumannii TaxID=470 RepID=UPI001C06BAB8